ncbi:MAG: outer membrane protein assembly factor BamE [Desulfobacteraceae bacterium]|nr:MAG: outer membrane protein assembly factor BamE [Desulfobacteraceae bacterium]
MIKKQIHFALTLLLWSFLLLPIVSNPTDAQTPGDDITRLQQKIIELELKVKNLETLLNESILIPKSDTLGWYNKKNWRKLTVGMTQKQVNEILGEPIKIIQGKKILWYYPNIYGGIVTFNDNGSLVNWNEP